jgi:chitinase
LLNLLDIDWEYPGGNGADYRQVPNSQKTHEIEAFPELLRMVRDAIGNDKILSIAVPGKAGDMMAFTKETGPRIWAPLDHVNVCNIPC